MLINYLLQSQLFHNNRHPCYEVEEERATLENTRLLQLPHKVSLTQADCYYTVSKTKYRDRQEQFQYWADKNSNSKQQCVGVLAHINCRCVHRDQSDDHHPPRLVYRRSRFLSRLTQYSEVGRVLTRWDTTFVRFDFLSKVRRTYAAG